jgi:hypothetical protein
MIFLISIQSKAATEVLTFKAVCNDTKVITDNLIKKYKEIPIIFGNAEDEAKSTMSFWINLKNKSWSIVATKDNISCIIGTGTDLKIIDYGDYI